MPRMIFCQKLQSEQEGLDNPPIPGEVGIKIYETISKIAWMEWLNRQTMLINEYRLTLTDPTARKFLREEMQKFLFNPGSDTSILPGYKPE